MSQNELYENLCKKCAIKALNLSKSDIKKMVMTEYDDCCDKCGRVQPLVEYIED